MQVYITQSFLTMALQTKADWFETSDLRKPAPPTAAPAKMLH